MRIFLKHLGYEKFATSLEEAKIGMLELPYVTEERLETLGIPMGPRLRILAECKTAAAIVGSAAATAGATAGAAGAATTTSAGVITKATYNLLNKREAELGSCRERKHGLSKVGKYARCEKPVLHKFSGAISVT